MRVALVLMLVATASAGGCGREDHRAAPDAGVPVVSATEMPADTLEATLRYGRASAALRTDPVAARKELEVALAALGTQTGLARLETFRARIRARLAEPGRAPDAAVDAGLFVQIHGVADLLDVMRRMPFRRVELVGPEDVRVEGPIGVLWPVVLEYLPPQPPASIAPEMRPQGGKNFVVKASMRQQDDIGALLTAWRDVWPLLWPAQGS